MKRIILGVTAAALLAAPGVASAQGGAAECSTPPGHPAGQITWKNPGKMFQTARDGFGLNPAQVAAVHGASVGEFVRGACR